MACTSDSQRPSSFSSSSNSKWRYDVFLSFRGKDTRHTFTDHLYGALDRGNINTFRDDEKLPRGEEISPQLLKAIEGSRFAIIVFSKNYANSKWCLDELVKIMECEEEKGQKVFPIFYHVEPTEVRNQTEIYGEAFKNHETNADEEKKKKIEEWRAALRKAGQLKGFHLQDGYESKFIEEIVGEIRRLIPKLVHVGENIVGMDENLKEVKLLIDAKSNEVSMVGIYGIGGIGKTTIAKVIYNDMLHQFKHHSFLENVREKSKDDHGLLQLQKKLLCDILMEKNPKLCNVDEGIKMIEDKCYLKKVLIVLDDVDYPRQLKFLTGSSECFGRGSIIIVTTRNKRCLDVHDKAFSSYEAKGLAKSKALELFCWNAFQQHHPRDNYMDLCNRVLHYANGLPLALVVLGSFLFQRDEKEWESTLCKLKTIPPEDIQKVLQISYDGLDDRCKKLFLDIACFFKDCREKIVTRILEGCRFHPKIELKILDERCLISISHDIIRMHDLLQEMGWAIVREKCPDNPEEWSRLWEYEDIKHVLSENVGTKNIEGMFLNETFAEPIQLPAEAFKKMNRLRLLKVGYNMVQLSQDFELPCRELTYLDWNKYSLESMPSNFHADKLVELHLQFSHIRHLGEGNMHVGMLKILDLSHSKQLVDISSISSAPNLEFLILEGCTRLKSLPTNLHEFKCLQTLSCAGCLEIKSFPENMGRWLRELDFSGTGIIEVPSSIRHLHGLEYLNLSSCQNLWSLPNSICSLSSLKILRVQDCPIRSFPEIGENMGRLRELNFSSTFISKVPSSIGHLHGLEDLDLSMCPSLSSLPNSIFNLRSLKTLCVKSCPKLGLNMELEIRLSSLKLLNLTCHILKGVVIWENNRFSSLKTLNPRCDQREEEILNHTYPLSSLVQLCITNSASRRIQNDSFNPYSLKISCPSKYNGMEGRIPSDIFHQSSMENLSLQNFNFKEAGIPLDNWYLPSLQHLSLRYKNLMEGGDQILNHVCHLSSLRILDLEGNYFSSIPAGISRLSNLRVLNLRHCKNLQQIPELPSSLRFLNAPCSNRISSSSSVLQFCSLIDWFKSALNQDAQISVDDCLSDDRVVDYQLLYGLGVDDCLSNYLRVISIVIPRCSGILEGISYQRTGSDKVTIELPPNWYENNDFLRFYVYCVWVDFVLDSEFYLRIRKNDKQQDLGSYSFASSHLDVDLSDFDESDWDESELGFVSFGYTCLDCDISDLAYIMCYPKAAIKEKYRSNQWTHLVASFNSEARVEGCSIHLIYAKDNVQMHPSTVQASSSHGNSGDYGSQIEDDYSKAHNKRSPIEHSPVDESHHKRFRGTQDC